MDHGQVNSRARCHVFPGPRLVPGIPGSRADAMRIQSSWQAGRGWLSGWGGVSTDA